MNSVTALPSSGIKKVCANEDAFTGVESVVVSTLTLSFRWLLAKEGLVTNTLDKSVNKKVKFKQ